jgi:uncharacterized protein
MANFFIIHGSFGSPFGNWFPWLRNLIEESGSKCFVPNFPSPDNQSFEAWGNILDGYLKSGLIDNRTVFFCHSSGCPFLVKYISQRNIEIKKTVFVSGFNRFKSGMDEFDKINTGLFFDEKSQLGFLKNCTDRVCYFSDNDPYLPIEVLRSFATVVDARSNLVNGGRHLNTEAGYLSFDLLKSEF